MQPIDLGYWANSFSKYGDFSDEHGHQYLSELAYRNIYKKIVTFEYEPGLILTEKDLINQLEMGRTPIREAVRSLSSHGIIEMHLNKALLVRPITIQNTKALFAAMNVLEQSVAVNIYPTDLSKEINLMQQAQEAMKKAVENRRIFEVLMANHVFHMFMYLASHNEYLIYALKRVRFEAERLGYISFSVEIFHDQPVDQLYDILLNDHEMILDCLKARDFKGLQETIYKHHQTFCNRIVEYLSPRQSNPEVNDWVLRKSPLENE